MVRRYDLLHWSRLVFAVAVAMSAGTEEGLATNARVSLLYSFSGGEDGNKAAGGLAMDQAGNLYGTTINGGTFGYGTVFKVSPTGVETVLHSFAGGQDGETPTGITADDAGNLYGTTYMGGTVGGGTVFKITTDGTEAVLHSFSEADGALPVAGVILDKRGSLYGTTFYGGANNIGTIFKLTPNGKEIVLHSFNGADGMYPAARLIMDRNGNFYGTTWVGGTNNNGTVFKLAPDGTETVLYAFGTKTGDGGLPYAGLIADKAGNLYGTTQGDGLNFAGNVFMVTPQGEETVIHTFGTGTDGISSAAELVMDKGGNLYGTTAALTVTASYLRFRPRESRPSSMNLESAVPTVLRPSRP